MSYDIFEAGKYYHVFSRTIGCELLFRSEENYRYFLERLNHFSSGEMDMFAYCLLPNHFHLLVKTKESSSHEKSLKAFSDFLNSYTKAFNKMYQRHGGLFQRKFKRKPIDSESYLSQVILYIHLNSVKHGLVKKPEEWKHSSYPAFLSTKPSKLMRNEVFEWFGGIDQFLEMHLQEREANFPIELALE